MKVPPDNPNEQVRLKRFPPGFFGTMVDWTTPQLRRTYSPILVVVGILEMIMRTLNPYVRIPRNRLSTDI